MQTADIHKLLKSKTEPDCVSHLTNDREYQLQSKSDKAGFDESTTLVEMN